MKKKLIAILLALCLALSLAACGSTSSSEPEEEPADNAAAEEAAPEEEAEEPQNRVYTYTEDNGSEWTITLETSGAFTLAEVNGISGETTKHSGATWTDNGDGTFSTSAWYDPDSDKAPFFEYDGACTWIDNGDGTVTPASDGSSSGEGINPGKYTYTEECGPFNIDWSLTLKSDGTFELQEVHGGSGETLIYTGDSWVDNGDGTVTNSAWHEEGDKSDYMEADGSCTWVINADGTCTPAALAEGGAAASEGINPGKYTYTEDCGDFTIEWAVCLNGNGSFQLEETHGLSGETLTYTGNEWVDNGDGTATTGAWNEEGDKSDFMAEDGSCTWVIYDDGTCEPVTE